MFNFSFNKLQNQLLPSFLRTPVTVGWLQSLIYPVKNIYDQFIAYRLDKLYELEHNGQVFSLENVLNDRFDSVARRIYLTDGLTKNRIYIYTRNENKPFFLPKFIFNRGDYTDTGVDFIVWIPNAIVISLEEMYELRAKVNKYKTDPKRYKVYRV
ncbi:MAG: hypothetical protein Q8K66_13075 [Sediminibacterium sp.]|nr:hypothetical protein [Sediminibacterium sp.]MDP3128833.1 hypothetical protein [Sediminibacterium sp.]